MEASFCMGLLLFSRRLKKIGGNKKSLKDVPSSDMIYWMVTHGRFERPTP